MYRFILFTYCGLLQGEQGATGGQGATGAPGASVSTLICEYLFPQDLQIERFSILLYTRPIRSPEMHFERCHRVGNKAYRGCCAVCACVATPFLLTLYYLTATTTVPITGLRVNQPTPTGPTA